MNRDIFRRQIGRQVLVLVAVVLAGAAFAGADEFEPHSRVVGADLVPPPGGDGTEKVLANVKCGTFTNTADYHFWYGPEITLYQCFEGEVRTSRGNANLYIYYGEPWSSALIPPSQAGALVCSSTLAGTATDHCNGCNYRCEYGVGGIWRSYAVPAMVPTDYCNEVWVWGCEDVDLSGAEVRRRGTEVEVTWEATADQATAGYRLYRRCGQEEEWVLVTDALVPASEDHRYRVVDTVPATAGDIFYRLHRVGLDGSSEHIANLSHELPMNDSFPLPVR